MKTKSPIQQILAGRSHLRALAPAPGYVHLTTPPTYMWNEQEYLSRRFAEQAVAESLCEYLCAADAGSVERSDGVVFCIHITAKLVD